MINNRSGSQRFYFAFNRVALDFLCRHAGSNRDWQFLARIDLYRYRRLIAIRQEQDDAGRAKREQDRQCRNRPDAFQHGAAGAIEARDCADGALLKFLTLIVHLSAALEQRAPPRLPSSGVATSRGPIRFVGLIVGAKDEQGVVNKGALKAPGLLWSQD